MDDLIAFLRARLDEDEEIANRWLLEHGDKRRWRVVGNRRFTYANGSSEVVTAIDVDNKVLFNERIFVSNDLDKESDHIARHDPVRVLADVAAKRRIIRECENQAAWESTTGRQYPSTTAWALAVTTLRVLALPYADHPDYREEWRP